MIVVLGHGAPDVDPGSALGSALRAVGEVVVLGTPPAPASADQVDAFVLDAENASGPLDGVVVVSAGAAAVEGKLAALDPDQWRDRVELPLQWTLACFQGAHRRLRHRGGGLVVVVPTLALVGASGFAPWAAVAEGQRSLAKSAARVWGRERITVNCVAVPATVLAPSLGPGGSTGPDRLGQPAPALAETGDPWARVAPVVLSLLSGGWRAVTGTTVAVDGGVWMTP